MYRLSQPESFVIVKIFLFLMFYLIGSVYNTVGVILEIGSHRTKISIFKININNTYKHNYPIGYINENLDCFLIINDSIDSTQLENLTKNCLNNVKKVIDRKITNENVLIKLTGMNALREFKNNHSELYEDLEKNLNKLLYKENYMYLPKKLYFEVITEEMEAFYAFVAAGYEVNSDSFQIYSIIDVNSYTLHVVQPMNKTTNLSNIFSIHSGKIFNNDYRIGVLSVHCAGSFVMEKIYFIYLIKNAVNNNETSSAESPCHQTGKQSHIKKDFLDDPCTKIYLDESIPENFKFTGSGNQKLCFQLLEEIFCNNPQFDDSHGCPIADESTKNLIPSSNTLTYRLGRGFDYLKSIIGDGENIHENLPHIFSNCLAKQKASQSDYYSHCFATIYSSFIANKLIRPNDKVKILGGSLDLAKGNMLIETNSIISKRISEKNANIKLGVSLSIAFFAIIILLIAIVVIKVKENHFNYLCYEC